MNKLRYNKKKACTMNMNCRPFDIVFIGKLSVEIYKYSDYKIVLLTRI